MIETRDSIQREIEDCHQDINTSQQQLLFLCRKLQKMQSLHYINDHNIQWDNIIKSHDLGPNIWSLEEFSIAISKLSMKEFNQEYAEFNGFLFYLRFDSLDYKDRLQMVEPRVFTEYISTVSSKVEKPTFTVEE